MDAVLWYKAKEEAKEKRSDTA
jgi:hypothetical protein